MRYKNILIHIFGIWHNHYIYHGVFSYSENFHKFATFEEKYNLTWHCTWMRTYVIRCIYFKKYMFLNSYIFQRHTQRSLFADRPPLLPLLQKNIRVVDSFLSYCKRFLWITLHAGLGHLKKYCCEKLNFFVTVGKCPNGTRFARCHLRAQECPGPPPPPLAQVMHSPLWNLLCTGP